MLLKTTTGEGDAGEDSSSPSLGTILGGGPRLGGENRLVERVLALARTHLDMDVAWFSRFGDDQQLLEHVQGDGTGFGIAPGHTTPYGDSYCSRVIAGDLPNVVPDARTDERTRDLAITEALGIGSYVGVPVVLPDGAVYGMMCCIGHDANTALDTRDLKFMRVLAGVLSDEVERLRPLEEQRVAAISRIDAAIAGDGLRVVFQPIVDIASGRVLGAESLSRFEGGPPGPDGWFREAAEVGRGVELELASLRLALAALAHLPSEMYLSINASPEVIGHWSGRTLPEGIAYGRLLLEITEHAPIGDYELLRTVLDPLRERGVRIAVDDAGAGYSSFRHILQINPDVIKLDMSITRNIDRDVSRRALATAFVTFAGETGATLVAEGVETLDELTTLHSLGVTAAQGYLLARPGDLPVPENLTSRLAQAMPAKSSPRILPLTARKTTSHRRLTG